MKKLGLAALIIGAIFFSACTGNSNPDNAQHVMSSSDDDKTIPSSSDTSTMSMADFSKEAALNSMMEVQLGNIAVKNGGNERIKNFGKMVIVDYTKINDDLKYLALKKNVTLPTSITDDQQKNIDTLSKQIGKDFDKYYVSKMIKDQEAYITVFKTAGIKISDDGYKSFISNALPIIERDLDAIEAIKKEM